MPEFWIGLIFVTTVGACVGSFLNVVAYRIPAGINLAFPRSACPSCQHQLAWLDNVPVLGWLLLRGRCRYCRAPISRQYPIVEAVTAVLFGGWFAICYATELRPAYAHAGPVETGMIFAMGLILVAALLGATLIDAEWSVIPLRIPYFVLICALIGAPIAVSAFPRSVIDRELPQVDLSGRPLAVSERRVTVEPPLLRRSSEVERALFRRTPGPVRICATPVAGDGLAAASLGGAVGLLMALGLLSAGVLKRSFELPDDDDEELKPMPQNLPPLLMLLAPIAGAVVMGLLLDRSWTHSWIESGLAGTAVVSMGGAYGVTAIVAVAAAKIWGDGGEEDPLPQQAFIEATHPRREACKELLFLLFPIAGAIVGWTLWSGEGLSQWLLSHPAGGAFAGSLGGALVGGAVAWAVRVFGTLGFGREAMGLGDVHLMVGIGAVVGWRLAVMIFFFAAFTGLAHAALTVGLGRLTRMRSRQIPYGPHLAASTLVMMVLAEPARTYFGSFLG